MNTEKKKELSLKDLLNNMRKSKQTEKQVGISPERLEELRRATIIASAGSSTRLEGSKLSDKEVKQIANIVFGRN